MMVSAPPASDVVLDRLSTLHPKLIDLSLDRTERLLLGVGNPERAMPPVIHVAGTNGKGSVIAFMRAIAESSNLSVHTYTSPHLIRYHERIVLNGKTIEEVPLMEVLQECESSNGGAPITFFEITTVAAFLAFSRHPADLLLLETGLGGRFDATNVVHVPTVTVITPVSIDHTQFLGETVEQIAFEKAGILKSQVPCIVGAQSPAALAVIEDEASKVGSPLLTFGTDWSVERAGNREIVYRDADGEFVLPPPNLNGAHQIFNAGTAVAALRQWNKKRFNLGHFVSGVTKANWPGRLQHVENGPLSTSLTEGVELWVDGGHNPAAGVALANVIEAWNDAPVVLICAMQKNKDIAGFLGPLATTSSRVIGLDLPGASTGHSPEKIAAVAADLGVQSETADSLVAAVKNAASMRKGRILICGSLLLAGEVLAYNRG